VVWSLRGARCFFLYAADISGIVIYSQAGGSLGTVFAWDLRWPQQPIMLSGAGAGAGNTMVQSISESEVWEVQYDRCIKSNTSSTRILPSMICSEDGILAVIEQGNVHCNLQHVKVQFTVCLQVSGTRRFRNSLFFFLMFCFHCLYFAFNYKNITLSSNIFTGNSKKEVVFL